MANVSWCRCCGKEYQVCPTCAEVKVYKPWRVICDTAPHYQTWLIVSNYRKGIIDKAAAKEQLAGVKLNEGEIATFLPVIQDLIADINEHDAVSVEETAENAQDVPVENAVKKVTRNKGRK